MVGRTPGDADSSYTGKSFYDCPIMQEETKKLINSQGEKVEQSGVQTVGVKTPI